MMTQLISNTKFFQMNWCEHLDLNFPKDLSCAIMYNIYLLLFVLLVIAFFDIYWILRLAVTRLLSKVANYSDM